VEKANSEEFNEEKVIQEKYIIVQTFQRNPNQFTVGDVISQEAMITSFTSGAGNCIYIWEPVGGLAERFERPLPTAICTPGFPEPALNEPFPGMLTVNYVNEETGEARFSLMIINVQGSNFTVNDIVINWEICLKVNICPHSGTPCLHHCHGCNFSTTSEDEIFWHVWECQGQFGGFWTAFGTSSCEYCFDCSPEGACLECGYCRVHCACGAGTPCISCGYSDCKCDNSGGTQPTPCGDCGYLDCQCDTGGGTQPQPCSDCGYLDCQCDTGGADAHCLVCGYLEEDCICQEAPVLPDCVYCGNQPDNCVRDRNLNWEKNLL
jgi:hypothetical protein